MRFVEEKRIIIMKFIILFALIAIGTSVAIGEQAIRLPLPDAITEKFPWMINEPLNEERERIVGGSNASPGDAVYQIALFRKDSFTCGGSLISSRTVLTAAHCVYCVPSPRFQVKLGSHVRINNNSEPMSIFLDNVRAIPHPGFTFTTFQDDLALIRLPKAIRYSNYIQPICLPDRIWMKPMVKKATVIGWGKLKQGGNSADTLQQVDLPIIDNGKCINWYREMGKMLTIR